MRNCTIKGTFCIHRFKFVRFILIKWLPMKLLWAYSFFRQKTCWVIICVINRFCSIVDVLWFELYRLLSVVNFHYLFIWLIIIDVELHWTFAFIKRVLVILIALCVCIPIRAVKEAIVWLITHSYLLKLPFAELFWCTIDQIRLPW